MMRYRQLTAATAFATLLLASLGCERAGPPPAPAEVAGDVHPQLEAHTAEFERKVYEVTAGVHQAILVEGDECVFIVDVMGSTETAQAVSAEFQKLTRKPIHALIYTHNHGDHVFGGRGFMPDGDVDVYAHETTEFYINRVVSIIRPIIAVRSARMFGTHLPGEGPDRLVNAGIGPFLEIGRAESSLGLIRPNKTFRDRLETVICGIEVELVHAPGETNDQIFVWLPEKKVLLPGDNIYKAFPNLYTIRGTLYRDVLEWSRSIDKMRALKAEYLAPSHTRPVRGADTIAGILTAYRDGIQYVHDQTIRGMNQGLEPDELVEAVKLPPHLRDHPYLQEFYGSVEWSVRSIFAGYLGWFDGDAATLSPAGPDERAVGFVELAGGTQGLLAAARDALQEERYAWAAELAGQLVRFDPSLKEARQLKAQALRALGPRTASGWRKARSGSRFSRWLRPSPSGTTSPRCPPTWILRRALIQTCSSASASPTWTRTTRSTCGAVWRSFSRSFRRIPTSPSRRTPVSGRRSFWACAIRLWPSRRAISPSKEASWTRSAFSDSFASSDGARRRLTSRPGGA
jgi:alkyl sulfatase BDS1-like metallo-beta-lactamase superfamily hydrolase